MNCNSSAVISTATGLGLGFGQGLAGFVGPAHGWRLPFLIVSAPSFIFATLCFFLEEPKRGSKEDAILRFHSNEAIGDNEQCREFDRCGNDCMEEEKHFDTCRPLDNKGQDECSAFEKRKRNLEYNGSGCEQQSDQNNTDREKYIAEEVSLYSTCKLFKTRSYPNPRSTECYRIWDCKYIIFVKRKVRRKRFKCRASNRCLARLWSGEWCGGDFRWRLRPCLI